MAGADGRSLTLAQSQWLAGTRYFNRDHSQITDGVGVQLVEMNTRFKNGKQTHTAEYSIKAGEGAYMLQLMKGKWSEQLALVKLDTWERSATVDIPSDQLEGVENIFWYALSATGGMTRGSLPVEVPGGVDPPAIASTPLIWGELKIDR